MTVSAPGVNAVSELHWRDGVLAIFNACILFCTALRTNEGVGGTNTRRRKRRLDRSFEPIVGSWLS
jgi:hypothetical protein